MRASAPGPLGQLQDFLNSGHLGGPEVLAPATADAIFSRVSAGESRATVATEYGLPQVFVSAIGRGSPVYDELHSPEAAADWLRDRSLLSADEQLNSGEHRRLLELREILRRLAIANTHGPLAEVDRASLDEYARSAPLVLAFEGAAPAVALRPQASGVHRAIGGLFAILFESIRDGSWQRLKRCPGNGCPFTFYDSSRNRTGTWCSMGVCGNRAKVRSYQARRREARPG